MRAVVQALTGQADGTCGARQGRRCRRACSVLGAGFLFVTSPIRQIINPGWPSVSNLAPSPPHFPLCPLQPDRNRPDPRDISSSHHLPQHPSPSRVQLCYRPRPSSLFISTDPRSTNQPLLISSSLCSSGPPPLPSPSPSSDQTTTHITTNSASRASLRNGYSHSSDPRSSERKWKCPCHDHGWLQRE